MYDTMNKPTEREAQAVSRHIPDDPGTVTFEVERVIVKTGIGDRVADPFWLNAFTSKDIVRREKRSISITTTQWTPIKETVNE